MQVLRRWKVDIKNPVSHHIYYCFNLKQLIYAHFNFSTEKKKGGRKGGVKEVELHRKRTNKIYGEMYQNIKKINVTSTE